MNGDRLMGYLPAAQRLWAQSLITRSNPDTTRASLS
jgi:hypothetical protein